MLFSKYISFNHIVTFNQLYFNITICILPWWEVSAYIYIYMHYQKAQRIPKSLNNKTYLIKNIKQNLLNMFYCWKILLFFARSDEYICFCLNTYYIYRISSNEQRGRFLNCPETGGKYWWCGCELLGSLGTVRCGAY